MENKLNGKYYGLDKREIKGVAPVLIWEIWENFSPEKVVGGDKKNYITDIVSDQQLQALIPFWKKISVALKDPILSLQLDRNGGATILYGYSDGRKGPPPNARYPIIKPIFEEGIDKFIIADATRATLVFHTSINSSSFEDDVKYFASIIEKFALTDEMPEEKDAQCTDFVSNTFVFDRRVNKK